MKSLLISLKVKLIRKLGGVPANFDSISVRQAKEEMQLAWPEQDEMQNLMKAYILDVLAVIADQGHSGFSHSYLKKYLAHLLEGKTLTPLTGEEHEWINYGLDQPKQNKRNSAVFQRPDGSSYWLYGKIFQEPNGETYTNGDSFVDITFPWTQPESEIIKVDQEGNILNDSNNEEHF